MLKKKLVSKFFILLLFIYFNSSFANFNVNQGEFFDFDSIYDLQIGLNKSDVLKKFGSPVISFKDNFEILGYYIFSYPNKSSNLIINKYVIMVFYNSLLVSYFYRV